MCTVYCLFCSVLRLRWGNVGEQGNNELSTVLKTLPLAVKAFEQRFKIKTANQWADRAMFVPKSFHFQLERAGHHVEAAPKRNTAVKTASSSSSSSSSKATAKKVACLVYLECREGNHTTPHH
jgi:hypothetical protein